MCWEQQAYQAALATLQVHTRKLKLDPDVTDDVLRQVARDLPGLSGRSSRPPLSNCCQRQHADKLKPACQCKGTAPPVFHQLPCPMLQARR